MSAITQRTMHIKKLLNRERKWRDKNFKKSNKDPENKEKWGAKSYYRLKIHKCLLSYHKGKLYLSKLIDNTSQKDQ